jgi:hypothetical protein
MANLAKVVYTASSALTFTSLNSLAASAGGLGGAESTAVDNSSNLYMDYLLAGSFTAGSANTQVGVIEVHAVGMLDDTTWPDVFDGTDSTETITSAGVKNGVCRIVAAITAESSASRVYSFGPVSVASAFGGVVPRKFVVFVTHAIHTSTNTWHSSGHAVYITPVHYNLNA